MYPATNLLNSAVKLDILTWEDMETDSLLDPHVGIGGTAIFHTCLHFSTLNLLVILWDYYCTDYYCIFVKLCF